MATHEVEKSTVNEKSGVEQVERTTDESSGHSDEKHPNYYSDMRVDGDGEDHMHEPPVRRAFTMATRSTRLIQQLDDLLSRHVSHGYGLHVDRLADSPILVRWVYLTGFKDFIDSP